MHANMTIYRRAAVVTLLVALLLGFTTTSPSAAEPNSDPPGQQHAVDPGTVLVRRIPSGLQAQGHAPDWVAVPVRPGETPEQAVERLAEEPGIEAASLNYFYQVFAVSPPDDPYFPDQWHLSDAGLPDAWEFGRGAGVTLAVIDTGVSAGGVDLACDTFRYPYNAATGAPSAEPEPGNPKGSHGTHVAGAALQCSDNGISAAGMAPGAALMPVRVADASHSITSEYVADGIVWAADHGADVINMSLGKFCTADWPRCGGDDQALNDAIAYAASKDIVIVGASGNTFQDFVSYPSNHPAVIAVGATTITRSIAGYSNGGTALDLVAPGGSNIAVDGILQESFDDATGLWGVYAKVGTSFASPLVAGTAALMRAVNPTLSSSMVREILTATTLDLGAAGWDPTFGAGLLQAHAAVAGAASAVTGPQSEAVFSACPDNANIPDPGFTDTAGSFAEDDIDCIAYYGVTKGSTPTTYLPEAKVTRVQMALFLARMAGPSGVVLDVAPPDAGFTDIGGLSAEAQLAINQLAAAGIVKGKTTTTYEPASTVLRQQMALFLARFLRESVTGPGCTALADAATMGAPFTDIAGATTEATTSINQVWDLVITTGATATTYAPMSDVTRVQMAAFVSRLMAHTNARPVGLNLQAAPMPAEPEPLEAAWIAVTSRDTGFEPIANTVVDAWGFIADGTTTTPFLTTPGPDIGMCDTALMTNGPPAAIYWDATTNPTACTVDITDSRTDIDGNVGGVLPAFAGASNALTLYAWAGAVEDVFNVNTTVFSTLDLN